MVNIYGTIGPACADPETLKAMFQEGMTGMRLNLSHCDLVDSAGMLEAFRRAAEAAGVEAPQLVIDTQGPELRLGDLENPLSLENGAAVRLGKDGIPVPPVVLEALQPGCELLLDDGKPLLDYVIENTDPAYVAFEIDCGWASAAGVDPVEYINRHAGRIAAVHVKENGAVVGPAQPRSRFDLTPPPVYPKDENGKPILPPEEVAARKERDKLNVATGTGIVDWKAVKAAADAQCDNVLYIVEREANYGDNTRLECLAADARWLAANI